MLGIFAQNMAAAGLVYSISAAVGTFPVAQIIYIVLLVFAMVQHILSHHVFYCVCPFCRSLVGSL